jgi:hypothetical protein
MNSEIARLIVERDIAHNIWDKNKTEVNRKLFLLLSKKLLKLSDQPNVAFIVTILTLTCLPKHGKENGLKDDPPTLHSLINPLTLFRLIIPIPQPDFSAFGTLMISRS